MIIRMKHKMSFAEADRLIERYYDGLTTGAEEKRLAEFLSQTNLPERYEPERAIFGYYKQKKRKSHFVFPSYARWARVAAAMVLVIFAVQISVTRTNRDYAYVNGEKITDIQQIKFYVAASLKDISVDVVDESVNLSAKELMKQQLGAFSNE